MKLFFFLRSALVWVKDKTWKPRGALSKFVTWSIFVEKLIFLKTFSFDEVSRTSKVEPHYSIVEH